MQLPCRRGQPHRPLGVNLHLQLSPCPLARRARLPAAALSNHAWRYKDHSDHAAGQTRLLRQQRLHPGAGRLHEGRAWEKDAPLHLVVPETCMHCREPQLAPQPRGCPQPPRRLRTPACQSRARHQGVHCRHRPNGFEPPGQSPCRGNRKSCARPGSRTAARGRGPGHHGVGVRTAHAEGARPCGEGPRTPSQAAAAGRSRSALARHRGAVLHTVAPWSESRRHVWVQGAAVGEPRPRAVVESHCSHQQAGQPCCPLRVTVAGLHGEEAGGHISVPRGRLRASKRLHERPNLDGIPERSSRAVQSYVAHVPRPEPGVLESGSQQYCLLGAVRRRHPAGAPILVDGR